MSMTTNSNKTALGYFPWVIIIFMSSVTFVGILSELMPSCVLPQIMADLGINEIQGGNLVGNLCGGYVANDCCVWYAFG